MLTSVRFTLLASVFCIALTSRVLAENSIMGYANSVVGGGNTFYVRGEFNTFKNTGTEYYQAWTFLEGNNNNFTQSRVVGVLGCNHTFLNVTFSGVLGYHGSLTSAAESYVVGNEINLNNVTRVFSSGYGNVLNNVANAQVFGSSNNVSDAWNMGALGVGNVVKNFDSGFVVGSQNKMNELGALKVDFSAIFGSYNQIEGGGRDYVLGIDNKIVNSTRSTVINSYNVVDGCYESVSIGSGNRFNQSGGAFALGCSNAVGLIDDSIAVGARNRISGAAGLSLRNSLTIGVDNTLNYVDNAVVLGFNNFIEAPSGASCGNYFMLGTGLRLTPTAYHRDTVVLGIWNKELSLTGNAGTDGAPSFILGNGYWAPSSGVVRSNSIVVEQSGRTTITSRNFITPTAQNLTPAQPEVLVVEGSATLKGSVTLAQRQGDIWMGDFGRTEDRGPAN